MSNHRFPVSVFLPALCAALFFSGCAHPGPGRRPSAPHTRRPVKGKPVGKPAGTAVAPKPVDVQAQQKSYDLGMKHYTEENYTEAHKAWEQTLRLGPDTALAGKARDNLKKLDQMLKTLQEIEK